MDMQNPETDIVADCFNSTGFVSRGMHRHNFYEVLFVLDGRLNFLAGDKIYHCDGMCLIFFHEKKLHTTEVDPTENYFRYNVSFRYKFVSDFLSFDDARGVLEPDCTIIPVSEQEKNELCGYFEPLVSLTGKRDGRSTLMKKNLLSLILTKASVMSDVSDGNREYVVQSYISDVVSYIGDNIEKKLVISDIAGEFYVSRSKLINDFKAATGITIGDYIMSRRIKMSKELLRAGTSVGETSLLCGFVNPCHFIRTFKKNTGVTPLKYSRGSGT